MWSNLIQEIRLKLRFWEEQYHGNLFDAKLIIVLIVPKKRNLKSGVEEYEERVFIINSTIKELGRNLGMWTIQDGNIGMHIDIDENKTADDISVMMLNPTYDFSERLASIYNDFNTNNDNTEIVIVGVGSLGSQIYNILVRQGIGQWTIIDDDIMLPHKSS
ncbi:MAG: hypothetical protein ACM3O3_10745 [Syntrophothermus sp.]